MVIITIGSWLVIIPVRFVYFICLFGVAFEDCPWSRDETPNGLLLECYNFLFKLTRLVLLIAGVLWSWSHLGLGLICLVISSIASSIRDKAPNYTEESSSNLSLQQILQHHWTTFCDIRRLIRFAVGLLWLWSHQKLSLYVFIFVLVAFVKRSIFCIFRNAKIGRRDTDDNAITNKENNAGDPSHAGDDSEGWIEKLEAPLGSLLQGTFLIYKIISYVSEVQLGWLWSKLMKLRVYVFVLVFVTYVIVCILRDAEFSERYTTQETTKENNLRCPNAMNHIRERIFKIYLSNPFGVLLCSFLIYGLIFYLSKKFLSSSVRSAREDDKEDTTISFLTHHDSNNHSASKWLSWRAMIGQNVNIGGVQTIGRVTIGDYNLQIEVNRCRDMFFNFTKGDVNTN